MSPCEKHPEKVQFASIVRALDELAKRRLQANSRVVRTYKCESCWGWHFTSKRRSNWPVDPFPHPYWYGVIVDGKQVWGHADQAVAERKAHELHGVAVPRQRRVR